MDRTKLEKAETERFVDVGDRVKNDIHVLAANEDVSDALFVRILRATYLTHAEDQERAWASIVDELKAIPSVNKEPPLEEVALEEIAEEKD